MIQGISLMPRCWKTLGLFPALVGKGLKSLEPKDTSSIPGGDGQTPLIGKIGHTSHHPMLLNMRCLYSQSYSFSSSHVWMWELDHKEGWAPKNWCFQIVVLEKTLECPLDCMEIKSVNPKGNQPWLFTGRTDAEAEAPILWPPDEKSWLTGKDSDAGKEWRQKETGVAEDEMVREHHRLDGHEFEQTLGDSGGQRSLACCSPWGCKELDTT